MNDEDELEDTQPEPDETPSEEHTETITEEEAVSVMVEQDGVVIPLDIESRYEEHLKRIGGK